jgi:hypothetical protein
MGEPVPWLAVANGIEVSLPEHGSGPEPTVVTLTAVGATPRTRTG